MDKRLSFRPAVETRGKITLLAGSAMHGFKDGPAALARFSSPCGIVCSADGGRVYVCDENNHRIRMLSTATQTVSTIVGGTLLLPSPSPISPPHRRL
jgi:hypothetical protein